MTRDIVHTDASVEIRLLDAGSFIADEKVLHRDAPARTFRLYDWAFYIHHKALNRHVLWDLGISSDPSAYPPLVADNLYKASASTGPRESIAEQLARFGVAARDIDTVLFSHAHWDHCRPASSEFPAAKFMFGPGTFDYCAPGHIRPDGTTDDTTMWDGRFFSPTHASEKNVAEHAGPWTAFGPFDKALDFFGDGSFWVISGPGHMPGNLCAAARTAAGEWVVLGSDCCHSAQLLDGSKDFAVWTAPDGSKASLHLDMHAARDTIARINVLRHEYGAHVALAHDSSWMLRKDDSVLMSLLDDKLLEFVETRLPLDEVV